MTTARKSRSVKDNFSEYNSLAGRLGANIKQGTNMRENRFDPKLETKISQMVLKI